MKHIVKLDKEPWYFTLFEVDGKDWIVSFHYSPTAIADDDMTIKLNEDEKEQVKLNRQYLIEFAKRLQNNHKSFYKRALDYCILKEYQDQQNEV